MATERHFGPEIVESEIGGDVVRDVKAATAIVIGTFPVHEVYPDEADWPKYVNKSILVRRRADAVKLFGPHAEGYTLPWVLDAIFDQDQGKGVGTIEVINVFDPAVHLDGSSEPDVTQVTNLDILGSFDAAGEPSGLKHAYATYQRYGWFPKFVAAPGFTLMTGVWDEMIVIDNKIRGRSYLDAPAGSSIAQVLAARGPGGDFDLQTDSRRANICWPAMRVVDPTKPNAETIEAYSATMLGVHLSSIMEHGYHHSPSNRPIYGRKAAQKVLYVPGQSDDDTQLLRGAGIVTCEERWGKGPHTSGNRSAAFPTDTNMKNFIHVQLTADMLHEGILFFTDEHKDRNANVAKINYVEGIILNWGLAKTVGDDPELMGFRFNFNRKKTTVQSYSDGHVFYKLAFMPVGLMEWITIESEIDINLAANPLGLAEAVAA